MARIDIGDITLNVIEQGTGPAFVFIPGLVGLGDAWSNQIEHFARSYRCVTFDHRGAGDSDRPLEPSAYSTGALASDVIALMDTLGIDTAHVAGTSTGGCVLQNLALDHKERVCACIFNNTWSKADEFMIRVQTTRKRIALSYGPEEYVKVSSMFTNGALQFREQLDQVMALERRSLATVAPVEVLAARIDMTLAHDRVGELGRIDRPSLVIGTRDDAVVPFYFADDIADAIPGASKHILPEGGHYSYRRHPQQWNALVEAFVAEVEARA
jgi:aminoacrylate hydrolase